MALPAIAGELLPERTRGEAAALLSVRHAGITLALVALAPLVAAKLDDQVQLARERGTAVVLDAALPPTDKIELAPRLFADIETDDPPRRAAAGGQARAARASRPATATWAAGCSGSVTSSGSTAQLLDRFGGLAGGLDQLLGGGGESASRDARGPSTSSATTSTTWCWPPCTRPSARRLPLPGRWRCLPRCC